MNSTTSATTIIDYAQIHGDELVRQARIANGGLSVFRGKRSSLLAWMINQCHLAVSAIQAFRPSIAIGGPTLPLAKS